ncbi:MAG: PAS domain-containing protein, partial [Rhodocyclales bacterium]|nr:PAS domain-containing protein [Rhodocyclales bacterium]
DVFHLNGSEKPYVTFFGAMNEGGVTLDGSGAILHSNPRFVAMIGRPITALRGTSFLACIRPADRPRVAEFLSSPATAACEVSLDTPLAPSQVRLSLTSVDTALQRFRCLVVTDLTEHAKAEAELRRAIERQRQAEIQLRQRERDLPSILDHVPSLIGYWDKNLRNRFGNHAYQSWFGMDPDQIAGKHLREVIGEERYRRHLPHVDAALRGEYRTFEYDLPTLDGAGIRHALAHYIPDVVDGEVHGFYVLVTDVTAAKQGEAAIRDSEERLRAMYANLQTMTEAERKHVAREVHDELGQLLTALRMETSMLQAELHGQQKPLQRVDEMRHLIEGMFKTVRSIAGSLRPSTLDLGLIPAIEWLAGDFEKRWHIDCALDFDLRDIPASEAYTTTVFRIIQESLTNVARHARARSVSISLRQLDDRIQLEIHDDGCGFVEDKGRRSGFGMIGMRERVLELGGELSVRSIPERGTDIYIDLPLAEAKTA